MPVKINGTTSGSVTLAAPATGSDVTLTLPGTSGSVVTQEQLSALVGLWQSYTPTFSSTGTAPVIGSGGQVAGRYTVIGDTVIGYATIQFGSSGMSAGSGDYRVSLPVAAASLAVVIGALDLADANTGARQTGVVTVETSTTVRMEYHGGTYLGVSASAPWTWAASDSMRFNFAYEAA